VVAVTSVVKISAVVVAVSVFSVEFSAVVSVCPDWSLIPAPAPNAIAETAMKIEK